jgi:hypothetical protein
MKKTLLLLAVSMLLAQALPAQWIVNRFETSVNDSTWTITKNSAAKKWYLRMSDTTASYEGSKALRTVWKVDDADSYGGNDGFEFKKPRAKDSSFFAKNNRWLYKDSTYFNFSGAKYISLWFNNVKKSSVGGGAVQMRLKLHEAGGNSTYWGGGVSDVEDWYAQSANVFDTTAGWKQLIFPLKDNGTGGPNDQGFTFPGWSGTANNSTLDLDKIIGYTIEWTCGKLGGAGADSGTANGEILWDKLQLLGDNYTPIYTFNNFTADTASFAKGSNDAGGLTFAEEKVDTLISPSALSVAYKVNIAQTWGGYANFVYKYPAGTFMQDLSGNTCLLFYVKVVEPLKSSSGTIDNVMSLRITLQEGAVGDVGATTGDQWYSRARVILDSNAVGLGWQMVQFPLKALPGDWGAFGAAPYAGFYAVTGSDGVMNLNKIKQLKIEFSASRDASQPYAADLIHSGRVLISDMVPVGTRSTDTTAPAMVTGVMATPGSYNNIVTWTDVPLEPLSKYDVYFSEATFTKTTDKGVENLPPFGQPLGTQVLNHPLRAPLTDQNITYYYGVTATDAAGNTNQPAVIAPVTNKALGVPIIALAPPTNITIDGITSDWTASTIKPFILNPFRTPAQGHFAPNGTCRDSVDLSAKIYMAIDSKNLYVMFDVADDTVLVDTSGSSWLQDSPDMFIGLYDWRGPKHGGYARGATPDYHLRFSLNKIVDDHLGKTLLLPSAGNYVWRKKTSGGYVVEAKIPFDQFKALSTDSLFVPKEGMRIPIDFAINDRDKDVAGQARDCILAYSYLNDDNSHLDSWRWVHTWIGAKWVTGVQDQSAGVVEAYALSQNYPNPFNPTTNINYQLPHAGLVTIKMFDVLGREVMTVVNGVQEAGKHIVQIDGSHISSGMYFYRLESGSFTSVKKMMLLK